MLLDALYVNGRFTTLDADRPRASALGVIGGRIVGFDEELDGCRAVVRHDLGGAPVVPGFHDAHQHLSARGLELRQLDVSPGAVRTVNDLYAAVGRAAAALPRDAWVLATGYDESKMDGLIDRHGLDAVADGRPVWISQCSHHSGVVNTEGIRRMGYTDPAGLPDVDGGWVDRRADGTPTGVIAERALDLVHRLIRPVPFEDLVTAIGLASRTALAEGLTSVTEPGICGTLAGNGPTDLAAFQQALDRGLLGVRMTVMPEIAALHDLGEVEPPFGVDLGLRSGLGDDRLRIGGVKVFTDGGLSSRTAALCCEYADRPGSTGVLHDDPRALTETILAAHRAGWQVATHAIGDAAVATVLDAYEHAQAVAPRPHVRHRIEHCGMATDLTVKRVQALGAVPTPQGRFLRELGDAYLQAIGPDRGRLLYRQKSFLDAGVVLPGSSDCPVVDGAPLRGIHALVNRWLPDGSVHNPDECLTPLAALRAFTYGSAYADHQEHRKGTLSRGKLADFVVLSDDLLAVAPERIEQLQVAATVVGGEVRHDATGLTDR